MPEGDKYDFGTPKGWGRAFRLLRENADPELCDRQLLQSAKGDQEGAVVLSILKLMMPELERALAHRRTLLEADSKREFDTVVDRLKTEHGDSPQVVKAVEIVTVIYLEGSDSTDVVPNLSRALCEYLVLRLLDLKQQKLMVERGEAPDEHAKWRRGLLARLRPDFEKLFAPPFEREGAKPRLSKGRPRATVSITEQLLQEVPVR